MQTRSKGPAAGNYVVVDGKGTGKDFVYMHMLKRGIAHVGDRVKTGRGARLRRQDRERQLRCHLHFEMWSRPGWYEGGSPQPPTHTLKKWDRYS